MRFIKNFILRLKEKIIKKNEVTQSCDIKMFLEEKSIYVRTLPSEIGHPKKNKMITKSEFDKIDKQEIQMVGSLCDGHNGTTIWHTKIGYIVQVKLQQKPEIYIITPCTYTPTFGIDTIDGMFIQDAEDYVLEKELGRKTDRLMLFQSKNYLDIETYLSLHGMQIN